MQIIDRRKVALGGQSHTRTRSKITAIAWHYTAVARKNKAFITTHETYWRNHHGWKRGGYHFYIDADGKIYQNYDYETVSNGVGGNNSYIVNICVEANSADDYSQAQIKARDWLTRKVMKDLNIPANRVMGHKEFPGQSTACPGYSKTQMDAFRRELGSGELVSTKPVAKPAAKPAAKPVVKKTESIVDYLNSIKVDSSPSNRKKIAAYHGIKNYTGTAAQNIQLLESVKKNGVTPKKAAPAKPATKKYTLPDATYWVKKPLFSGTGVRQVQEALASIYFYPEKGAKNNGVDGYYGAKTADAVRRFQSVNGLKADGDYGPATKKVLDKKVNK